MLDALVEGQILLADRAYDSDRSAPAPRRSRRMGQHQAHAEPQERSSVQFLPYTATGTLVERFFNKIKHYRAVATRYDKRADQFPRWRQTRLNPYLVAL